MKKLTEAQQRLLYKLKCGYYLRESDNGYEVFQCWSGYTENANFRTVSSLIKKGIIEYQDASNDENPYLRCNWSEVELN